MSPFQFDTARIIRTIIAVVFTILSISHLTHAQSGNYVPAECFNVAAVHKSLKWMLTADISDPLKEGQNNEPPYWECEHDGTDYKPNVLHVSAALDNYGPPYDDLTFSSIAGELDPPPINENYKTTNYTELNPHYAYGGEPARLWIATHTDLNRCYSRGYYGDNFVLNHYLDFRKCGDSATANSEYEDMYRRFQRADDAYSHPMGEWFREPFEPYVKRALADGLQGRNPHTGDGGNDGDSGNGGGSDIGNGDGDPADFQGWTPFQATENAFDSLKGCIADKFQHLFDVAQQKFPVMFGSFVPESSISNASATSCQDYSITMMGITKPLPFCDNPIMNAIRNVVRPALLALYMISAYIGLSRLVAWS